MNEEDKQLLLRDLCARIPYGVKVSIKSYTKACTLHSITPNNSSYFKIEETDYYFRTWEEDIKPYLRPMNSMTREECRQLFMLLPKYYSVYPDQLHLIVTASVNRILPEHIDIITTFYNSHHFDWRELIQKGLALKANDDMYKF